MEFVWLLIVLARLAQWVLGIFVAYLVFFVVRRVLQPGVKHRLVRSWSMVVVLLVIVVGAPPYLAQRSYMDRARASDSDAYTCHRPLCLDNHLPTNESASPAVTRAIDFTVYLPDVNPKGYEREATWFRPARFPDRHARVVLDYRSADSTMSLVESRHRPDEHPHWDYVKVVYDENGRQILLDHTNRAAILIGETMILVMRSDGLLSDQVTPELRTLAESLTATPVADLRFTEAAEPG